VQSSLAQLQLNDYETVDHQICQKIHIEDEVLVADCDRYLTLDATASARQLVGEYDLIQGFE